MNLTSYKKYLSKEEANIILDYALKNTSPSVYIALQLISKLGVRVSEACKVNLSDIDFVNKKIIIHCSKQGKVVSRVLPDSLIVLLKNHINNFNKEISYCNNFICFAYGHGARCKHISKNTMGWFFKRVRIDLNLDEPYFVRSNGRKLTRITAHTFRSLFITLLYNHTKNIRLVQQEIGHSRAETTWEYVRFAEREEMTTTAVNAIV